MGLRCCWPGGSLVRQRRCDARRHQPRPGRCGCGRAPHGSSAHGQRAGSGVNHDTRGCLGHEHDDGPGHDRLGGHRTTDHDDRRTEDDGATCDDASHHPAGHCRRGHDDSAPPPTPTTTIPPPPPPPPPTTVAIQPNDRGSSPPVGAHHSATGRRVLTKFQPDISLMPVRRADDTDFVGVSLWQ